MAANERHIAVEIEFDIDCFASIVHDYADHLPAELQQLLIAPERVNMLQHRASTPAMHLIAKSLLACPYQGLARQLYLESKALELTVLFLTNFDVPARSMNSQPSLRADDITRIHQARDLILDRMDSPPTLLELARAVGLNDYKLKIGFRQVFGTTVFGYLHQQRTEQARQLLAARDHNITEVAYTVGYTNPSQFTAAFKRAYGVTPSDYRASQCA